jgi:ABC-type nitrate/sulfonate/bicarbonate transport system permease component
MPGRFGKLHLQAWAPQAVSVAVGLTVWEIVGRLVPAAILAPPSRVLARMAAMVASGELPTLLAASSLHLVAGFGLAVLVALPTGFLMGRVPWVSRLLDPLVTAFYSLPTVSLVPLIVIWYGLFYPARVALVFCMSVPDMIVVMAAGARDIDQRLVDAGRSLGAGWVQQFRKVLLPASLPFVFTALRVGAVRAINGMITAELFFAAVNLGASMKKAASGFDSAGILAVLVTLCLTGLVVQELLRLLETWAAPWRQGVGNG